MPRYAEVIEKEGFEFDLGVENVGKWTTGGNVL